MSIEYDLYLNEHKMNVMAAFDWLAKNVLDGKRYYDKIGRITACMIRNHDETKYESDEYIAYDEYFYGTEPVKEPVIVKRRFDYAWLHHIHNNPHHWQHWVLINDDAELGAVALEMPIEYVIEMVCDWWSFGWKNNNLYEIFDWYEKNKDHMILHENTRKEVEYILKEMRKMLYKKGVVVVCKEK